MITGVVIVLCLCVSYYSATKPVTAWHARKGAMRWWGICLYALVGWPASWATGLAAGLGAGSGFLYAAYLIWGDALPFGLERGPVAAGLIGDAFAASLIASLFGVAVGIYRATQYKDSVSHNA